jgi:preprotein translocase subunit SecG
MSGFLTFITLADALIIIVLVLMQRSKSGGGLGAVAGGQSEIMFGANASNVLAKMTAWCSAIFFILIILTILSSKADVPQSEITASDNQAAVIAPAPEAPAKKKATDAKKTSATKEKKTTTKAPAKKKATDAKKTPATKQPKANTKKVAKKATTK